MWNAMQARMRLPAWNEARLTYLWGEESNSAYMRARDQLTLLQINCLSCNGDPSVRFTIAMRCELTADQINRFLDDTEPDIRWIMAHRSGLTAEQRELLSHDHNKSVRQAIKDSNKHSY
jgi:hypothetical protein